MDDQSIPPIEREPPYSMDFIAHLHGGCYPDAISRLLVAAVRADPDGARMLDGLEIVQLELRLRAM